MYTVQHKHLIVDPVSMDLEVAWRDMITVPQFDTEQQELQAARRFASRARGTYRDVRIVKTSPGGTESVVV